jgi:serine/threonine protein kinase
MEASTSISSIGKSIEDDMSFVLEYSCQDKMNEEIENKKDDWLRLGNVLQNVKGKNISTMTGLLEKKRNIVVKVQSFSESKKEYDIQEQLKDQSGFIRFLCFFTCKVNQDVFNTGKDEKLNSKLCSSKGNGSGIIIMPYYNKGSFEDFLKKYKGNDRDVIIKTIIIKVVHWYFKAFSKKGFTHGDLFPKNVILRNQKDPVIIDFEKSSFNRSIMIFWRDIQDFLGEVCRFVSYGNELDNIVHKYCIMNLAVSNEPSQKIINDFAKDISGL